MKSNNLGDEGRDVAALLTALKKADVEKQQLQVPNPACAFSENAGVVIKN